VKTWYRTLLIVLMLALPLRAAWANLPMMPGTPGMGPSALVWQASNPALLHADCHEHVPAEVSVDPRPDTPHAAGFVKAGWSSHGCCAAASVAALPAQGLIWRCGDAAGPCNWPALHLPALSFIKDVHERPPRSI
jgi:hypothetical protein